MKGWQDHIRCGSREAGKGEASRDFGLRGTLKRLVAARMCTNQQPPDRPRSPDKDEEKPHHSRGRPITRSVTQAKTPNPLSKAISDPGTGGDQKGKRALCDDDEKSARVRQRAPVTSRLRSPTLMHPGIFLKKERGKEGEKERLIAGLK